MANPQPEPSMEEILASIRRIISEDEEEPAPQKPTPAVTPRPAAAAAPVPPAPKAPAPVAEVEISRPAPAPAAKPAPAPVEERKFETEEVEMIRKNVAEAFDDEDAIIDETAASAASQAFRALSSSVKVTNADGPGRSLEELVVEMLRPMVKDWLDANLPALVEEKVEEEVQRIARRRR